MKNIFASVSRMAIEELVLEELKPSKFGFLTTKDGVDAMVEKIHELFLVSRSLQAKGALQSMVKPSLRK